MIVEGNVYDSDLPGLSSHERVSTALVAIGPAILNGGMTTGLALVFLGFSNTYPFIVMFKVLHVLCKFEKPKNYHFLSFRYFLFRSPLACFTD
jgi:hypothetical protein